MAKELITDPSIIFADEPTSGLDSFSALMVVSLLKQQASYGKMVLCSLHQPSFEILDMLDGVIVLDAGRTIYCVGSGFIRDPSRR